MKTREQKIREMVALVDDWNTRELVEYVKAVEERAYNDLSDEEIDYHYGEVIGDEPVEATRL